MSTLTIRISTEEKNLLQDYAKFMGISVSDLIRQSAIKEVESSIDLELYKRAVKILDKKEPTISHDELLEKLGL